MNVVELTEQQRNQAAEVLQLSVAHKLGASLDNLHLTRLKQTSDLMAKLDDGYVIYMYNGLPRAALVINIELEGCLIPFIFHTDNDIEGPVGLLYADVNYHYLGDFQNYICNAENLYLYHAIADLIPLHLNGIGVIQAIENAKRAEISCLDEVGLRRVAKATIAELAR